MFFFITEAGIVLSGSEGLTNGTVLCLEVNRLKQADMIK